MIEILPYAELETGPTVSDETIRVIYEKMKSDGTLYTVFYDGTINSAEQFLSLLKSKNNYPIFILIDGMIGGVAWFNDLFRNRATAHFCGFKEVWGTHSVDMGKEALKYWFSFTNKDGSPMLDVILGVTPSEFSHAVNFIQKLGFKIIGEVPKVSYHEKTNSYSSATLSYIERNYESIR
jgi:hypothetical protein